MLCNSLHPITANNHNNVMQFVTPHHCQQSQQCYAIRYTPSLPTITTMLCNLLHPITTKLCNSLHPITGNNHNNVMQFVTPHHNNVMQFVTPHHCQQSQQCYAICYTPSLPTITTMLCNLLHPSLPIITTMLCNLLHPITANNHNNVMQFVTPHHCQ